LIGVPVDSDHTKAENVSPVHYITPDVAPVLILHGTSDPNVPFQQSQEMADLLKAAGVDVYLQHFPNAGHNGSIFNTADVHKLELAFLNHYLKGENNTIQLLPDSQATFVPAATQPRSYCQMSWMKPEPQAAILVPSLKIVPAITAGSNVLPFNFRQ
jgi:acetyl esterase/lipase